MALPGLAFEIVRTTGPVLGIRADQTAMIALTERGPAETPTLVHGIEEFTDQFGAPLPGMLGALAAQGYYDNGGQQLIVTRFVPADAVYATATLPTVGATQPYTLPLVASGPGAFGNEVQVETTLSLRRRTKGGLQAAGPPHTFLITGLKPPVLPGDAGVPARVIAGTPAAVQWGKITVVAAGGTSITFMSGPPAPGFPPALPATAVVEVYDPTFSLTIGEPARANVVVPNLDLRDLDDARRKLAGTSVTIPPPLPTVPTLSNAPPSAADVELPLAGRVKLSGGADGISVIPPDAMRAHGSSAVVGATAPLFVLQLEARDVGSAGTNIVVHTILTVRRLAIGRLTAVGPGNVFHLDVLREADAGAPAQVVTGTPAVTVWGKIQVDAQGCHPVFVPGTKTVPPGSLPQPATIQVYEPTFTVTISQPLHPDVTVTGLDLRNLDAARAALAATSVTIPPSLQGTLDVELPVPGSVSFSGGSDGTPTAQRVLRLAASFQTCIDALEIVAQPPTLADIVIAPDLWSAIWGTKGAAFLAFDAPTAIGLADQMVLSAWRTSDRVVILDPPLRSDLQPYTPADLVAWRADRATRLGPAAAVGPLVRLDSAGTDFAATFAPWVRIIAGGTYRGDDTMLVPPSGHVAGRMARTSRERGPWIATGNVSLEDVVGLDERLSIHEQEALQAAGISPLRVELPVGATIQGVRSLSWPDPHRRRWGYLSTRRLFNFLRRAILPIGLSYVFEPNTPATWLALRRDLTRLLRDLFLRGALAGAKPSDAFFVKIDAASNPPEAIDAGVMTALIGVAPAIPLEFLVVQLVLRENTASVTEASP